MGNHVTVTISGASGHLELNVFKPVIIYNLLHRSGCSPMPAPVSPTTAWRDRGQTRAHRRAAGPLADAGHRAHPKIGYDNAAKVAKNAHAEGTTLKEAAIALGLLTAEEFDELVRPEKMLGPA